MLISLLTLLVRASSIGSKSYASQGCANLLSFYNPTTYACSQCLSSTVVNRAIVCSCRIGVPSATCGGACTAGQIRSTDGTFCLGCPGATVQVTINGIMQTVCDCNVGEYYLDRDASGNTLATATCQACPAGSYPSTNRSRCIMCSDPVNMIATFQNGIYNCQCKTNSSFGQTPSGGQCIPTAVLTPALNTYGSASKQITITAETSSVQLTPDFINDYFISSLATCNEGSLLGCQVLSNICVMAGYNRNHPACAAYLLMAEDNSRAPIMAAPFQNQPLGLPWIYWTTKLKETPKQTIERQPLLTVSSGRALQNSLRFQLGVFEANGNFLGYQNLTSQLQV